MSKGGLPPIPVYNIHRRHWLDQNLWLRSFKRVNGVLTHKAVEYKNHQKELCKLRKEKYK